MRALGTARACGLAIARTLGLVLAAWQLSACPTCPDIDDDDYYESPEARRRHAEARWEVETVTRGPLFIEPATPNETNEAPRFRVHGGRDPECLGIWSILVQEASDLIIEAPSSPPKQSYRWRAFDGAGDGPPEVPPKRCFTTFTYGFAPEPLSTAGEVLPLGLGRDGPQRYFIYVRGPTYPDGTIDDGQLRFHFEGGRLVTD